MAGTGNRDLGKEAFWREAFLRFAVSGQSRAEFCAQNGLKLDNFTYWKTTIKQRDVAARKAKREAKSNNPAEAFVEVINQPDLKSEIPKQDFCMPEISEPAAKIVFAGCTLHLFNNVGLAMLKNLFQALRESDR